jgi:hypothetical protein
MGPLSAIGQAAGVAAALAFHGEKSGVRAVPASAIRWVLREQGQFIEGPCSPLLSDVMAEKKLIPRVGEI